MEEMNTNVEETMEETTEEVTENESNEIQPTNITFKRMSLGDEAKIGAVIALGGLATVGVVKLAAKPVKAGLGKLKDLFKKKDKEEQEIIDTTATEVEPEPTETSKETKKGKK